METFGFLKFRRNAPAGAGTDDDEKTDDEGSFFDLVLKSPDRAAVRRGDVAAEKDFEFLESPRDVFPRKTGFSNSKASSSPVNPLPPATTKFRVFMLSFRKTPKCEKIEESNRKLQVASVLMARDDSLRSQLLKETSDHETSPEKSPRESVTKYMKLIKPLQWKVWKRHNMKARFTRSLTPSSSPVTARVHLSPRSSSESSRMGSLKTVAKHFGKSRSASAGVGVAWPPTRRRDDLLLERVDGIQSAVLYCKKSYNSSSTKGTFLPKTKTKTIYV